MHDFLKRLNFLGVNHKQREFASLDDFISNIQNIQVNGNGYEKIEISDSRGIQFYPGSPCLLYRHKSRVHITIGKNISEDDYKELSGKTTSNPPIISEVRLLYFSPERIELDSYKLLKN